MLFLLVVFCVRESHKPGVFFYVDNYSKVLPVGIPTLRTGVFRHCLWTAQGILRPPYLEGFAQPDYKVRPNIATVIPAITSTRLRDMLFREYGKVDADNRQLHSPSASRDVRTVPLTVLDENGHAVHGSRPEPDFIPVGILPHNVSGNLGLIRILLELRQKQEQMGSYIPLLADVNIFRRVLRVRRFLEF